MRINFLSSLDTDKFFIMYTKSNNMKFMNGIETNDIIKELFDLFLEDTKKNQNQK